MSERSIHFPEHLPVSQRREEIASAIAEHQVVIVAGETGSGKTTQLPKICLELGRTAIGHTQPRRIAARTIAERVAAELGSEVGDLVGYQVRFTDESSADTKIKLMTDGILLGELRRDRLLRRYDTIIIDEAHERSLNIDFLLGYLRRLLPKRPDLKVIVTSATIDPESFSKHFADAPIIEVSGRTFPVEVRYRPLVPDAVSGDDHDVDGDASDAVLAQERDLFTGIIAALRELEAEADGDVLVFLPGEREIRDAEDAIRGSLTGRARETTEVVPLYGRLSARDQHRVFEASRTPGIRRRVVLATNVAETSLTVPGIAYVIDSGLARISRYSTRAKVQRLPIEAISQASANQRSGRSGRTRDGIAIRLYSEQDFARRPEYTDPEILRTNLASVLLQMASLQLGEISDFPFLTPPDQRGVKDGLDLLTELGAIRRTRGNSKRGASTQRSSKSVGAGQDAAPASRGGVALTRVGRDLAKLPIDPRYGRMVVAAREHDVAREVLIIVAGLTVPDIRERPLEHRAHADQLHARFRDPSSDFFTLLNIWNYLEDRSHELGSSAFRKLCRAEYLNMVRFREWQDLFRQLRELATPLGLKLHRPPKRTASAPDTAKTDDAAVSRPHTNEPGANADAVHKALLTGLLSHIGVYDKQRRDFQGARNTRFRVFPGSGLAKAAPDAVMAAELVETSQLFARTVAKIDPAWAEQLAGDLVKRQHGEPHWERKQGQAVTNETVTLYGVPLVRDRRIGFARINPQWSRDLFLRHALVEGDWNANYPFDRANRQLRRQLEELEERTRQRGLIEDDERILEFFDERIPQTVVSQPTFDKWWREAREHQPKLLNLTRADLLDNDADTVDETAFPRYWQHGEQRLKLQYKFDPNAPDDGVTAIVPLPLLAMLEPEGFDWQVPGLRAELVTALLRTLPKATRRNFVPAADWAARLLALLGDVHPHTGTQPSGTITGTLHEHMQREAGMRFDEAEFDLERVPAHLRMRFRVVDDRGRELGVGMNLSALQQRLKRASEAALVHAIPTNADAGRHGAATRGGSGSKHRDSAGTAAAQHAASVSEQQDVTAWPADSLPESFDIRRKHGVIRAWPTLKLRDPAHPATSKIDLVLATTAADQAREHDRAVAALLARSVPSPASYVQAHLTASEKLALAASPYPSVNALIDDVLFALAVPAIPETSIRTRAEFDRVRDAFNAGLVDAMFEAVKGVAQVLTAQREALAAMKRTNALAFLGSLTDMREQLDALIFNGFISRTGIARLPHLQRYLRAISYRCERLSQNAATERAGSLEMVTALALYREAGGTLPPEPDASATMCDARWMLEELRVSLFAQQLGTATPASLKRLRKLLA
ncbi:ATP-dependent RNA helicase HrpA [Gulosibacter bifidus]|uniref:ATP-dependent RNA helicase HrpA n=1 Tax=Gulosibacter bifidus TaxID=272239 RepID=A0ABW5RGY9_9MICO|nr:ATP-dependent RNA helicase HrpA [Gulosibacter bifidus]